MTKSAYKNKTLMGAAYGAIVLVLGLVFMHVDLMETANHAYVLLDCIFSGRFLDFYNVVTEHANTLYYINGAHYSIIFYIIYAIWELPMWLINTIFGLPVNEGILWVWAKGPAVLSAIGCGFVIQRIVERLGYDGNASKWALLLNPVFVFFAICSGQYDSIGLLFTLLALWFLIQDKMLPFLAFMGIAICCKFFAMFLLVPVLLLRYKKLWEIAKSLVLSMIPWAVITLLYMGRTGNSTNFTASVFLRLFAKQFGNFAIFPVLFVLIAAICWLKPYENGEVILKDTASVGLAVFGSMLLFIDWHPQWAILMIPFWVLRVSADKNKTLYYYLNLFLSAGVMIFSWLRNPGHFELNLIFYGIFYPSGATNGLIWGRYPTIAGLVAEVQSIAPVLGTLVYVAIVAVLLLELPLFGGVSLADKHLQGSEEFSLPLLWLVFGGCLAVFAGVLGLQYFMM